MASIRQIDNIIPYPIDFDESDWDNPIGIQRKTELTIFEDCDTIPVMWQYKKARPHMPAARTEFYDKYYDQYWFDILHRKLYEHYGYGKFISILFARLKPNGQLKPHIDGGISVVHNHDVHVPITTNQDCLFTVGEETRHLDIGNIYEVDNAVTHSVVNGNTNRVHLLVEWHNPAKVRGYYEKVSSVHGDGKTYRLWRKQ